MSKVLWVALAIALSLLTLVAARQFLIQLPADHFCHDNQRKTTTSKRIIQRIAGILLLLLGALLAIPGGPGQGLLLVLMGLVLLDLPPLRRLELRLLRVPVIARAVNRTREGAGKPPLQVPQDRDN